MINGQKTSDVKWKESIREFMEFMYSRDYEVDSNNWGRCVNEWIAEGKAMDMAINLGR